MKTEEYLFNLEKALGVNFKNKRLLLRAMTHRSYLNEHRNEKALGHNERLELLGDAVLRLVVTEYLYRRLDSSTSEGELTNIAAELVNNASLMQLAQELQIPRFLRMSRGQQKDEQKRGVSRLHEDAFEAVIGALYLDRGKLAAEAFILDSVIPRLRTVLREGATDWKSQFQELVQGKEGITPHYKVINHTGPAHAKEWTVALYVDDRIVAVSSGPSIKHAETEAALRALAEYGK